MVSNYYIPTESNQLDLKVWQFGKQLESEIKLLEQQSSIIYRGIPFTKDHIEVLKEVLHDYETHFGLK